MEMIFDSHAHYDDDAFDEDREELLLELPNRGIGTVINVGASIKSTRTTLELSEQYEYIYAAVGVHPSDTGALTETDMEWLKEQCAKPKTVAVGEIGLDYYWQEPEKEIQKKWFIRQMELAYDVNLPVIIHSRDAAKDTIDIMRQVRELPRKGVIHCYSYTKELAREFLDMGYMFGVGGVVTFKNGRKLQETVEYLPMDAILLETDCPYLSPEPSRGKRNSSLNIPYVVTRIAEIKHISEDDVMRITRENAQRLFSI